MSPAGAGDNRRTGCHAGVSRSIPELAGATRLKGRAMLSGNWPGATASNTQMPALNASSAHSPLALVRVENVRCPRKSPPANPNIASTWTSASGTGAPAGLRTLPVSRSSGCAERLAAAATAAAAQTSERRTRACIEPPLASGRHPVTVDHNPRPLPGMASLVEHDAAVDDHRGNADWVLERIGEGRAIGDGG